MNFLDPVYFINNVRPDPQMILNKVKENTGLDIIMNNMKGQATPIIELIFRTECGTFQYLSWNDVYFEYIDHNLINISIDINMDTYLFLAIITTLVELGGEIDSYYDGSKKIIPYWAKMKYEDVIKLDDLDKSVFQ